MTLPTPAQRFRYANAFTGCSLLRAWQVERDDGALSGFGTRRCGPAGLPCKAIDLAEAKARALAHILGGIERLEDVGQHILGYSTSGIRKAQDHEVALQADDGRITQGHIPRFDQQTAALRHGIPGVDGDVEDGEFKLVE